MPAGIGRRRARTASVGRGPIALIGGIVVTPVAVACDGGVGDEVVAGQHVGGQVRMRGDAGIDHRHHDALAGGAVPGRADIEAGGGGSHRPLLWQAGVVGRQQRPHQHVHFHPLDGRVGGKPAHQAFRVDPVQAPIGHQQHRAGTEPTHGRQAQRAPLPPRDGAGDLAPRSRQPGRAGAAYAVLVADDETLVARARCQALQVDLAGRYLKHTRHRTHTRRVAHCANR